MDNKSQFKARAFNENLESENMQSPAQINLNGVEMINQIDKSLVEGTILSEKMRWLTPDGRLGWQC